MRSFLNSVAGFAARISRLRQPRDMVTGGALLRSGFQADCWLSEKRSSRLGGGECRRKALTLVIFVIGYRSFRSGNISNLSQV
jgi:hypothetical protein